MSIRFDLTPELTSRGMKAPKWSKCGRYLLYVMQYRGFDCGACLVTFDAEKTTYIKKTCTLQKADMGVPADKLNTVGLVLLSDNQLRWYYVNTETGDITENPNFTEQFKGVVNVRRSDLTDPSNSSEPIDKFTDIWMDWNATNVAVAYKKPDDQNSHMCLLRRHLRLTDSGQSSEGRRMNIPPFPSQNKELICIERLTAMNCFRVVWSLDNSLLVFVGDSPIASEHKRAQRVGDKSSPSNGLFFFEVNKSVAVPMLITKETGVSHVVHSLQTGPLVMVLQQATAHNCRLPGEAQWRDTMARRNAILRGYALLEGSTGRQAQMVFEVSLQFYSFIPQRLLYKHGSSSFVLVGVQCASSQELQIVPLSLERQFNRLETTEDPFDTSLANITGGTLTTLNWDSGKDEEAPDEVADRIGLVTQHPILQCVLAGFKEHEWNLRPTPYLHPTTILITSATPTLPKAKAVMMLDQAKAASEQPRPAFGGNVGELQIEDADVEPERPTICQCCCLM